MIDYYRILNISKSSSADDIKKAYRQLALFWHPDKNKANNATEMFIKINEAYNVLSNANKRFQYDTMLNDYAANNVRKSTIQDEPFKREKEAAVKTSKTSFEEFKTIVNRELGKAAKSAPKVIWTIWLIIFVVVMIGLALGLIK